MHHRYIDQFAYQDSVIHRLDPRAKILAVLIYTVAMISLPRYDAPAPAWLIFPAVLLLWGGIPLRFVLRKIVLVSPFILTLVVFSYFYDRTPVRWGEYVVPGGRLTALAITLRFVFCAAALIALVSTTRFPHLLKGFEKLGMPALLVNQLRFLYRYLYLLIDQVMHIRLARRARDAGRGSIRGRWKSNAGLIGVLFTRTYDQAERTYQAMLVRGYDGTIHLAEPLRWRAGDTLFMTASLVYIFMMRWGMDWVARGFG
jgi:cobalt/nickel transport system permease protein